VIGCSEFCGCYDWTFEWLRRNFGQEAVERYWRQAISADSQRHAAELIVSQGVAGMMKYWGHTLAEEKAGYVTWADEQRQVMRIEMHACPSLGYNLQHGYRYYHDYCDHCMGWLLPIMERAGFVIHHDHNHRGQCWWEMRRREDPQGPSQPGELTGRHDVRLLPDYQRGNHHTWHASQLTTAP